ncbi:MAG: DUF1987 domain-containing protein [Flavobacteriia bacterium]|jgi:hypothetical protein
MTNLFIKPTNITPEVNFDLTGKFSIKGISIPEKATEFYSDVFQWIEQNKNSFQKEIEISLMIEYMNTPSKKFIILLLTKLIEICEKQKKLQIIWMYDHEIEDIREEGEILEEVLEFPFKFVAF